jgi:hypothetical protein
MSDAEIAPLSSISEPAVRKDPVGWAARLKDTCAGPLVRKLGDKLDEPLLRSFKEVDDLLAIGLPLRQAMMILSFLHEVLEEHDLEERVAPQPSLVTDLVAQICAYMQTNEHPEIWISVKLRRDGGSDDDHDDICFEFVAQNVSTRRQRGGRLGPRWKCYCSARGIFDDFQSTPVDLQVEEIADHWFFKALGDAINIENQGESERRVARICARHLEPFLDETVAIGGHLEAEFLRLSESS